MILPDVNVLVYAHREDSVDHPSYRDWLEELLKGGQPYGCGDHVLSGFLRVVTNPRLVSPGFRHWQIFADLCEARSAAANLVPDLWFAALAMESDCEWITTDRDYQGIPGLRTRHPLR